MQSANEKFIEIRLDANNRTGGASVTTRTKLAVSRNRAGNMLSVGTRLHELEILDLIGEGGFSFVYLAKDHSLERIVALKEYMPASLAVRTNDGSIVARTDQQQSTFGLTATY